MIHKLRAMRLKAAEIFENGTGETLSYYSLCRSTGGTYEPTLWNG